MEKSIDEASSAREVAFHPNKMSRKSLLKSKVKKSNMDIELDNLVMAPALRSF